MQTMCRPELPLHRSWIGRLRALGLGLGLMWMGTLGATAQTPPRGAAAPTQALVEQARHWLARELDLRPQQVQIQSPDPRVPMPACPGGARFDTPFSNQHTVRVRCEAQGWQLFLRASWENKEALAGTNSAANASASSAAAAKGAATPAAGTTGPSGGTGTAGPNAAPQTASHAAPAAAAPPRRALVLARAVSRGGFITPASADSVELPAREMDTLMITDPRVLDQVEAVRDLPAGTPLRHTDIRPATLVRQGQWVTMTVGEGTGFTITVRLEALQDGRLGDRVMLRNAESGRTVTGVVVGVNAAKGA